MLPPYMCITFSRNNWKVSESIREIVRMPCWDRSLQIINYFNRHQSQQNCRTHNTFTRARPSPSNALGLGIAPSVPLNFLHNDESNNTARSWKNVGFLTVEWIGLTKDEPLQNDACHLVVTSIQQDRQQSIVGHGTTPTVVLSEQLLDQWWDLHVAIQQILELWSAKNQGCDIPCCKARRVLTVVCGSEVSKCLTYYSSNE